MVSFDSTFFTHSIAFALTAFTLSFFRSGLINISIGLIKRMSVYAVGLLTIINLGMFFGRDWFKVFGINTFGIFTSMMQIFPFWNWTNRYFISISMCFLCFSRTLRNYKMSISPRYSPSPIPTRICFINIFPKALLNWIKSWRSHRITMSPPAIIMLSTPTTSNTKFITIFYNTYLSRHLQIIHYCNPTGKT